MPSPHIYTTASTKGGVGKSTIALELASVLGAITVDFDWDSGSLTCALWGVRPPRLDRRLVDALMASRIPRPLHAAGRPPLVPGHHDLALSEYEPELVAQRLQEWADVWQQPVVVDTHPGAGDLAYAAVRAANVVVVPVPLRLMELAAVEGMLTEFADYPMVLAPNMVPPVPPQRPLARLEELARHHRVPVAPPVSEHRWLSRRAARRAVTLVGHPGAAVGRAASQYRALATFVQAYAERAAAVA